MAHETQLYSRCAVTLLALVSRVVGSQLLAAEPSLAEVREGLACATPRSRMSPSGLYTMFRFEAHAAEALPRTLKAWIVPSRMKSIEPISLTK